MKITSLGTLKDQLLGKGSMREEYERELNREITLAKTTPNFRGRKPRIKNTPARIKSKGFDLNRISPSKLKKWAGKLGLKVLILLLFAFPAFTQQPSLYLDFPDSSCTTLLTYEDDSVELASMGYELNEEWVSIGTDTFPGFWLHERFFVPDRGIVLTIMDCGTTFDYVPDFGANQEPVYSSKWEKFVHTKSQPIATWSRIAGYAFMAAGGYFGSEGERQRVINGLDSPAFHHNRDISLACAFTAGTSFTLSWTKTPNLKWWEPVLDIGLGSALWYAVAQKNWESYK